MSHILIQNKGELPIWGMRLLGLSRKSADKIGRFGTGLKESIALLIRMDKAPVIFTGKCRIDFVIQHLDDQDEICFMLSEPRGRHQAKEWHGLGIHPNFGKEDWDDPWMAFREIICNALDEVGVDNIKHDICSTDLCGEEGTTKVYVPMCPETLAAYSSIHERLLPLGNYEVQGIIQGVGSTIKKRSKKKLQIFHKGVWVQEHADDSLFDYELDDLKLNESRSADWFQVNGEVAKIVSEFSTPQIVLLLSMMFQDGGNVEFFEKNRLLMAGHYLDVDTGKNWREAFSTMFGEKAVMTTNDKFFFDKINKLGKKPIVILHDGLFYALRQAGVPHSLTILSKDERKYEVLQEPSPEAQAVFDEVWNSLAGLGLADGKQKPGLMMFKQRPGDSYVHFGAYENGVCHINMDCSGSRQERQACLEEIGHHISGAEDESEEFQHWLVECLERLI